MKKIKYAIIITMGIFLFSSCGDFLDQDPESILTDDEVFGDKNMILSVLANYYGRVDSWGQNIDNVSSYIYLDEACKSNAGPDYTSSFDGSNGNWWRVYDYDLIRNINQFLKGLNSDDASGLEDDYRNHMEGEARFLRAWTYFNMCRCLGGMPIVGNTVFEYTAGMDVTPLQLARSTEAEMYDYIINECTEIARILPSAPTTHAARANKWAALALKARAAIYAASLAKYNNLMDNPITTEGEEVGISADKATAYYQTALNAAQEVIDGGVYSLYEGNSDKALNFYEATSIKDNNTEVIWAKDHVYPGETTGFTKYNIPRSVREDNLATCYTPILNLVEAYEYIDDRDGTLRTEDGNGNYIFYDNPGDVFNDKDPRLSGSIIISGAEFKGQKIVFQAGQKYLENGEWKSLTGDIGSSDDDGDIITSTDGPTTTNEENVNKSGFCFRKFLDEASGAGTIGQGSEMWFPYFRYAEILLIASESSMELGVQGNAMDYINQVRDRAGIQDLSSVTLDDIVQENRVEFAFENHRFWDLKRWRLAHKLWTGNSNDYSATHYALFPYLVKDASSEHNGQWVYDKQLERMSVYPRNFRLRNYYNYLDEDWLDNNPKLVKNPYQ